MSEHPPIQYHVNALQAFFICQVGALVVVIPIHLTHLLIRDFHGVTAVSYIQNFAFQLVLQAFLTGLMFYGIVLSHLFHSSWWRWILRCCSYFLFWPWLFKIQSWIEIYTWWMRDGMGVTEHYFETLLQRPGLFSFSDDLYWMTLLSYMMCIVYMGVIDLMLSCRSLKIIWAYGIQLTLILNLILLVQIIIPWGLVLFDPNHQVIHDHYGPWYIKDWDLVHRYVFVLATAIGYGAFLFPLWVLSWVFAALRKWESPESELPDFPDTELTT